MKTKIPKLASVQTALVGLLTTIAIIPAPADDSMRAGHSEFYASGLYMGGNKLQASSGVSIEPSIYGGGLGGAYNFGGHFNLNAEIGIGSADIKGSSSIRNVSLKPLAYVGTVGLDWNLLKSNLTPLLTASGGVIGYQGDGVSETDWIAGVGAGVRWDISKRVFAKVIYKANFSEIKGTTETLIYHSVMASVGIKF